MSHTFHLPDLGEGLTEADIIEWKIAVGDEVSVDQSIVEVETAKAAIDVPSPYEGVVLTLHVDAGQTLAVGAPLITIGSRDAERNGTPQEPAPAAHPDGERYREEERAGSGSVLVGYGTKETAKGRRRRPRSAASTPPAPPLTPAQPAAAPSQQVVKVISPVVRNRARDGGLDLATVTATGAGGVITRRDVESALAAATTEPAAVAAEGERRRPMSAFRKAVAVNLSRSRSEIPEATVWVDVDATPLWDLREASRTDPDSPGLLAYIARFVVVGLREYPMFNARLDTNTDEVVEYEHIHLGIAVQGQRGLVVPAIKDTHQLTARQLDREIRDVAGRARDGNVSPLQGTFTLNNYGALQVDGSVAIINHPQVGILGIGRIMDRPWAVNGELTVRKITQLSFAFDHRISDGAEASAFLRVVADAIENPASVLADL